MYHHEVFKSFRAVFRVGYFFIFLKDFYELLERLFRQ